MANNHDMDRTLTREERKSARIRRAIPYIAGGIIAVAIAGGLMLLTRKSIKKSDLEISVVDTGTIETTITASGKVTPAFEEIINSPISTRIMEVYCKAGDSVDAGTPLLRLDLQSTETELNKLRDQIEMKRYELEQQQVGDDTRLHDLAMQVEVKEMTVDRLRVELANERYLDSLGSGTGDRVRQAELAYRTGCLELRQLRQQLANERRVAQAGLNVKNLDINIAGKNLSEMNRTLDDARIRAPRRAILTYINDQIGQKVAEGERIAIISDLSHFKIEGEIADAYGDHIGVGSRAVIRASNRPLDGTVSNIAPQSRGGVISFSIRLDDAANPALRAGLRTDIYIKCDVRENVLRIRNGTYYTGPGSYELFVMDGDGSLRRRSVRLGESNYEYVEVIDGLRPGDKVAVNDMKDYKKYSTLKIK